MAGGHTPLGAPVPPIQDCIDAMNLAGGRACLRPVAGGIHAWNMGLDFDTTAAVLDFFGLAHD